MGGGGAATPPCAAAVAHPPTANRTSPADGNFADTYRIGLADDRCRLVNLPTLSREAGRFLQKQHLLAGRLGLNQKSLK